MSDERDEMVGWNEIESLDEKRRISKLILEAMESGKHFIQPDWKFLDDPDEE